MISATTSSDHEALTVLKSSSLCIAALETILGKKLDGVTRVTRGDATVIALNYERVVEELLSLGDQSIADLYSKVRSS